MKNKPRNYWTYEKCREETLKFKYLYDFRKESPSCYSIICSKGWSDLLRSHLEKKAIKAKILNKEICHNEALKYKNKKDFRNECPNIYNFICKNGWVDELCGHLKSDKKENGYWTKERCKEEANKYRTKTDFRSSSKSCYSVSVQRKWIDEICQHMEILGNHYKRFIYSYEFSDNHVYVGLTYDIKCRKINHEKSGVVFDYVKNSNIIPIFKQLIEEPVDVEKAIELEDFYLQQYINKGWIPLNKVKTGGLGGGTLKWTFEKIQEVALNYKSTSEFNKDYSWAYQTAKRRGWLDEILSHMTLKFKASNYWNYDRCKEEALKYKSKKEFNKNCNSAYQASVRNKWLDDICYHMDNRKPNGYYTLEKCIELANECENLKEFNCKYVSAHTYMYKNKWEDIIKSNFRSK